MFSEVGFSSTQQTQLKADSHLHVCSNKKRISKVIQKYTFTYGGGDKNMAWFVGLDLGLENHLFAEI